jgi:Arc/MetJ-type ribon-helix-helix transcriptional regulator
MDIEISLTGPEREYVDQQIRSGRAASEGEVLREALQFRMEHEREDRDESEQWREAARRSIEIGHQECLDGKTVDGEAALERMRLRIAAWKPAP